VDTSTIVMLLLAIVAIVLFVVAAFGWAASRVNLMCLGLACWATAWLISVWPG